jgi:hypothetical protein
MKKQKKASTEVRTVAAAVRALRVNEELHRQFVLAQAALEAGIEQEITALQAVRDANKAIDV